MSKRARRIATMRLLVAASMISRQPTWPRIEQEFQEIEKCALIKPNPRRRLLQVLHMTRVLDTTLKQIADELRCLSTDSHSLGDYLRDLERHGALRPSQRRSFREQIVDRRNRYMHAAGTFPSGDPEVDSILSAMESCLTVMVTALGLTAFAATQARRAPLKKPASRGKSATR